MFTLNSTAKLPFIIIVFGADWRLARENTADTDAAAAAIYVVYKRNRTAKKIRIIWKPATGDAFLWEGTQALRTCLSLCMYSGFDVCAIKGHSRNWRLNQPKF